MSDTVEFGLVDPALGREAYQWHSGFAANYDCIFPRPWGVYEQMALDGRVWCARTPAGDYRAISYFFLDGTQWEVGGVSVATTERRTGLGATIARLTIGHLLFEEDPLDRGESIVAHVHADNSDPRRLIEDGLKFRFVRRIVRPGSTLPGLRTNQAGDVEGDEFELVPADTLPALAEWCESWTGKLKGDREARIVLRPGTSLQLWARAFKDMASRAS
jgi:hypothetical protein